MPFSEFFVESVGCASLRVSGLGCHILMVFELRV